MRRGVVLALSALVAVLLAGCGGGGAEGSGDDGAHGNNGFYGVISAEPLPGNAELARLGAGGVGTLRINLAWGSVQSGPDAPYDWSHYDPVVRGAAENGVRVLATVYSTPSWAAATAEIPPLGSSLEGFRNFARAAVERYGPNGTLWKQHPDVPKLPITDWQLWNEPNSPLFWKPSPDPGQYLRLLRTFNSAVKGPDPQARILLGGLFPTPSDGISLDRFLSSLYEGGGRRLFDAVAIHPYARTPRDAIARVGQARGLMRRFGDSDKPIWITEVGWASRGTPPGLVVGPGGQADYLRQTFELAAADRDRLGIAGVVWYSLNDTPGPLWVGHCGLFTLRGEAKAAFDALVDVTGGSTN
jgi:polysaccharide biosynthesis protein PslG